MKSAWKRTWRVGGIFLLLFLYGFAYLFQSGIDKGGSNATTNAVNIATGVLSADTAYKWGGGYDFDALRENCDAQVGSLSPSPLCIAMFRDMHWHGCARWRFERCTAYEASAYLLSRPDLLGGVLHAMENPCVYLPKPESMKKLPQDKLKYGSAHTLKTNYESRKCGDGRSGRYPEKLILNFYDHSQRLVARYVLMPEP